MRRTLAAYAVGSRGADRPAASPRRSRHGLAGWRAPVLALAALVVLAHPSAAREPKVLTTPLGLSVWHVEEHAVPIVAMRFAFLGGSLEDPPGKEGLSEVLLDLLDEGAGELTAEAFKERRDTLAARISFSSARDAVTGRFDTLSRRLAPATELLRLAVTRPAIEAGALARVVSQQTASLGFAENDPRALALDAWYAAAFPGAAYSRPSQGTAASLATITREDVAAHHRRLFTRSRLAIVIAGDIDANGAARLADTVFGSLPAGAPAHAPSLTVADQRSSPVVVTRKQPQALAVFGLPGLGSRDPDYPAALVVNHILGSGDFEARLTAEVRVKRGLAYSIETRLVSDSIASTLVGEVTTRNEEMGRTLEIVRAEIARLGSQGPTDAEVDRARRFLTGSLPLGLDTTGKIADVLLSLRLDGQPTDYLARRTAAIAAVTVAEARRAAQRLLDPARLVIAVAGEPRLAP